MKNILFVTALILGTIQGIFAQTTDNTIESIRKRYTEYSEKARLAETDEDRGQYDELFMNELAINKLNHQWRAVGIYQPTYKFFYKGGDSEEHMYPDQLVMVKVTRRESDRSYAEEFLYSDTGVLMFHFQRAENDNQAPADRRVYFSGVKAIRIIEDGKTRDKLSTKDVKTAAEIAAQSARIKAIFKSSLALRN